MKKFKLSKAIIIALIIVASSFGINPINAKADDWIQNDDGRLWYKQGNSWATGWKYINGKWYCFGQDGYVKNGWVQDTNGKWYFLNNDGSMATNVTINGYYLDSNGVWIANLSENKNSNSISFDKNLEKEIRNSIGKQSGELKREDLLSINELNLYNKNINSLDGIENLENLTKLNIKNNNISNIYALSKLKKLKSLDIGNYLHGHFYYNSIQDITPLKSLTNLETLSLSGLKLTNIDVISNLTNLKELEMYSTLLDWYTDITPDITPIKNLSKLEILNLGKNNIKDISALKGLKNLKKLSLEQNKIIDITPLKDLNNLEEVDLVAATPDKNNIEMLRKFLPSCTIEN
jgi:hypothetical protein